MSEAPDQNPVAVSSQPLVRINGESIAPEVQQALQEIDRLVAASAASADDGALVEAMRVLAELAPIRLRPAVQPSTLPIIGGVATRLKRMLHDLILFYLNDMAAQQSAFNHQVLKVLQRMAQPHTQP